MICPSCRGHHTDKNRIYVKCRSCKKKATLSLRYDDDSSYELDEATKTNLLGMLEERLNYLKKFSPSNEYESNLRQRTLNFVENQIESLQHGYD